MKQQTKAWPAIVVGAGAAGLIAAIFAARGGVPVLLVETRPRPGAKIRVSGGGRCNILPSELTPDDFHTSGSRHTMRKLLFSWPLHEVRAFFEDDLGIALKAESSGKVFPRSDDARDVVDALLGESDRRGVTLRAGFRVVAVRREKHPSENLFVLENADGESLYADSLVLATGGLSLPKTGSDGFGMQIAHKFGHRLIPTYPALVPLRTEDPRWHELRGITVGVRLTAERCGRVVERREGSLLFTHRGFSGPVVLDLSHQVTRAGHEEVLLRVHWGDETVPSWDERLRAGGKTTVGAIVRRHLPRRLADLLLEHAAVDPGQKLGEITRNLRRSLLQTLTNFRLPISGDEGYKMAEVTGGGISLSEVKTRTLESRRVPGLYLCGEILDATGRIGGYNFLWAWVTGRQVGVALASARDLESEGPIE